MLSFIFPVGLAFAKLLVSAYVSGRIQVTAEYVSVRRIFALLTELMVRIAVNVLLLLVAVYGSRLFLGRHVSVIVICSVYMASIVESIVRLLRGLPDIFLFTIKHRFNLRSYINARIRQEVLERLYREDVRGLFFKRLFKKVMLHSNEQIAYEVAQKATPAIWNRVLARLLITVTSLVIYVVVFRFVVAPYLVTRFTKLTIWQALLYPLAFASDFFFGTHFEKWVQHLGPAR